MKKTKYLLVVGLMLIFIIIISGCSQKTSVIPSQGSSQVKSVTQTDSKVVLPIEQEQNGIKINLTKVEQDSDSLKIYVTYTNNSKNQLQQNRAADKIVANGKQFDCDPQFNLDRVAKLNLPHPDWLEPGVSADDVILFSPVQGVDKINIALYPNSIRFSFENVPLTTIK
jgi:hypothetical protein